MWLELIGTNIFKLWEHAGLFKLKGNIQTRLVDWTQPMYLGRMQSVFVENTYFNTNLASFFELHRSSFREIHYTNNFSNKGSAEIRHVPVFHLDCRYFLCLSKITSVTKFLLNNWYFVIWPYHQRHVLCVSSEWKNVVFYLYAVLGTKTLSWWELIPTCCLMFSIQHLKFRIPPKMIDWCQRRRLVG